MVRGRLVGGCQQEAVPCSDPGSTGPRAHEPCDIRSGEVDQAQINGEKASRDDSEYWSWRQCFLRRKQTQKGSGLDIWLLSYGGEACQQYCQDTSGQVSKSPKSRPDPICPESPWARKQGKAAEPLGATSAVGSAETMSGKTDATSISRPHIQRKANRPLKTHELRLGEFFRRRCTRNVHCVASSYQGTRPSITGKPMSRDRSPRLAARLRRRRNAKPQLALHSEDGVLVQRELDI